MIRTIHNCFAAASIVLAGSAFAAGVTVSGAVENKLTLHVADLKQLPLQQADDVPQQQTGKPAANCQSAAKTGQLKNLKGVLLRDILEKAIIVSREHNDVKKIAIVATGNDGYKAVFSWSEVFNSPIGEGVIVFFEKDGQPLADEEERIAMISMKDIRTGQRHIWWLKEIEVIKVVD